MELEARLYRLPITGWRRWWAPTAPAISIRLAASRARYGLPRYRLHHALTDALASAELLQAQVADRFSPVTPVAQLWR
jgi:DNA polymerase-3 subunit epsilon